MSFFSSCENVGFVEKAKYDASPFLTAPPFDFAVSAALICATEKIIEIEAARSDVNKRERASLAAEAQPCQDFIDRIVFAMAGLSDSEMTGLDKRLTEMA